MKNKSHIILLNALLLFCSWTCAAETKKNVNSHSTSEVLARTHVDMLVEAIFEQKTEKVKSQIKNVPINARDQQGVTLLMAASSVGDMSLLNLILQRKPDLELKSVEGETALGMALHSEQVAVVKKLRSVGASYNSTCGAELSSLFICAVTVNNYQAVVDIAKVNPQVVRDINLKDGNTALHIAAESGTEKIVKALLTLGVDKKMKNKEGLTALDLAKQMNRKKIILLLQGK